MSTATPKGWHNDERSLPTELSQRLDRKSAWPMTISAGAWVVNAAILDHPQHAVVVSIGHPDAIGTDAFVDRNGAARGIRRRRREQRVRAQAVDQVGGVVREVELPEHQVGGGIPGLPGRRCRRSLDNSLFGSPAPPRFRPK